MMNLLIALAWIVGGAIIGGAIGVAFAVGVSQSYARRNPGDLSAGSVGIIVIATAPIGFVLDALISPIIVVIRK